MSFNILKFLFPFLALSNISRYNIKGFINCSVSEKKKDYIKIDFNDNINNQSKKLFEFLNNNNFNECNNLEKEKEKEKDNNKKVDIYEKEKKILEALKEIFYKNNSQVEINSISIKDINNCYNILPEDLLFYYNKSDKDFLISRDKNILLDYFKKKCKDQNVNYKELEYSNLLRIDEHKINTIGDLINCKEGELKEEEFKDIEGNVILFIIFQKNKNKDFQTDSGLKFDINIYYKKKITN